MQGFIDYCEEHNVFPKFLIRDETWRKNMIFLFSKMKEWYHSSGKAELDDYLKQNITIVEGIIPEPAKKNCAECPDPIDYRKEWQHKPFKKLSIIEAVERKVKDVTGKGRK